MPDTPANTRAINIKRRRKPGTLDDARLALWRGIDAAQEVLYKAAEMGNQGGVLSAVHAITQAAGAYARLVEATELEERIEALESAQSKNPNMRKVA